MKYIKNLLFLYILFSCSLAKAQLFRLEAGVGATQISWLESQATTDLNVQLSIQKKQSKRKFFGVRPGSVPRSWSFRFDDLNEIAVWVGNKAHDHWPAFETLRLHM